MGAAHLGSGDVSGACLQQMCDMRLIGLVWNQVYNSGVLVNQFPSITIIRKRKKEKEKIHTQKEGKGCLAEISGPSIPGERGAEREGE